MDLAKDPDEIGGPGSPLFGRQRPELPHAPIEPPEPEVIRIEPFTSSLELGADIVPIPTLEAILAEARPVRKEIGTV